jgi:phage gp29-like protein
MTRRLLNPPPAPPVPVKERAPRRASGRVVQDLALWAQLQRIGGSTTPKQVSDIIRQADAGRMSPLMDLGNEYRQKDCHLQSILGTSEDFIGGLKWSLTPPHKPTKREEKAARILTEALKDCDVPKLLSHHAGARFYGYAVSESLFQKIEGLLLPVGFVHLAPRRFGYRAEDGRFVWRDEGTDQTGIEFYEDNPGKFINSHPRVNGDVPCREGLIRVLMWASLFRNWSIADWLRLGEIAWKPWRIGKYPRGTNEEDVENLRNILEKLSATGVALMEDTHELQLEWAKAPGGGQGKGTHAELAAMLAGEQSKAVLGQTLTTEQGRVGSQALGKVHNEVRKDIAEAMARYICEDITRDLIAPLYKWNWPSSLRSSHFTLHTAEGEDIVAFSTGVEKLVKVGMRIGHAWAADRLGIPEPEDGDEILKAPEQPATETDEDDTNKPGGKPEDPDSPAETEEEDDDKPEATKGSKRRRS